MTFPGPHEYARSPDFRGRDDTCRVVGRARGGCPRRIALLPVVEALLDHSREVDQQLVSFADVG